MSSQIDALIEQSNQCHEHLRESNRKKDTILGFYISATFIVIGIWGNYSASGKIEDLFWISLIGLVLAGIALGALLTLYRGWHGLYIITSIVLQDLIQKSKNTVDIEIITEVRYRFNSWRSAEFMTYVFLHSFIVMNLILSFLFTSNSYIAIVESDQNIIMIIITVFVSIEFISHFFVMFYLDKLKNSGKLDEKYLWMLNGRISRNKKA